MIRTLLALLPAGSGHKVIRHLALTVLSVVLRAVTAILLVPLIGALFGPSPVDAWRWVGALAAVIIAGWIVDFSVARLGFDLGFGVLDRGQHSVANQVTRSRLTWFTAENTATVRQAISATGPDLVGLIVYLATPLLSAVLLPAAIAIALLPIAWPVGLAALAGVPILLGAYLLSGRLSRGADRATADANSQLTERIVEFARTQHALRASRRVTPERSHVGAALSAQHSAMMRMLLLQVPGQLLFGLASQLALLLLAGTTVLLAVNGQLSVPEAIALILVIVRYLEPFTSLAELAGGVESTTGVLRNIRTVLTAPVDPSGGTPLTQEEPPAVALRDVTFRYAPDDPPVLHNFDLELAPGLTTAIVGPSGSGKSTVLALIAGLHQPDAGTVLFDGVDAAELDPDSRRRLCSVVFQHPYLFDGTIRENIQVGDPSAPDLHLRRAATLANVDEIVEQTPGGWDAQVGEAGTSLSGGQRQRVSIARALLKNASVLLVDEATSALDTENESAITAALGHGAAAHTRVIVAHRLASIRAADRVVFVEDGRIVEDGGVDDLLASGGRFAEFWRQQAAATGWRLTASQRAPATAVRPEP